MQKAALSLTEFWPPKARFRDHFQNIDIAILGTNYPLIYCSTGRATLIKVGEHEE
jgi:hypothetical protein